MSKFLISVTLVVLFLYVVTAVRTKQSDKLPLPLPLPLPPLSLSPSLRNLSMFNVTQQPYIRNVENITTTAELEDYFATQIAIYIDNAFNLCQRFLFKLLSVLPKSQRFMDIKMIAIAMDKFLEVDDVEIKLKRFDQFFERYANEFKNIFEYDAIEVGLTADEFHKIYIGNGVDQMLFFVDRLQMREFVDSTVRGIRHFLDANRLIINRNKMQEFNKSFLEFIKNSNLQKKREVLNTILKISEEFLD